MKGKLLRPILFIVVTVLLVTLLFACSEEISSKDVVLSKISLENLHEGDYVLGEEVDLSEITVTATYSDGEKRVMPLTDDMLTPEDRDKFFKAGIHTITVNYGGLSAVFQIKVYQEGSSTAYLAQFFSNGGTNIASQVTDKITEFLAPTREGYTFKGWYTTIDFSGSVAMASVDSPFILKEDTNFYALWEDNRRCNVKFWDEETGEVFYDFQVVYGESINIRDLEAYPAPPEEEGRIFMGWALSSGSTFEMTTDTVIKASYQIVSCSVRIACWDEDANEVVIKVKTLDYNTYFDVDDYVMPTRIGHTSRWVVYHESDNYATFTEFPEGTSSIRVTEGLLIAAEHVINTYRISISNGAEEQDDADLKSGNIALEPVYFDAATLTDYTVDYGNSFIVSSFTQTPYLKTPKAMTGYDVYWCFVTNTLTGEVWRNTSNKVWNEDTQTFELLAGEEETTNYILTDRDGNYVAQVRNGDLYNIMGNVTLKAKYVKKTYTVRLLRYSGGQYSAFDTFEVKYRNDFVLYDPEMQNEHRHTDAFADWTEVESYYLLHNVIGWSTEISSDWRSIYYNVDSNNPDDWGIEWYSTSTQIAGSLVDFSKKGGRLGLYEITDNLDLYCKDIDLRRYQVVMEYGYNFATGTYDTIYDFNGKLFTENEPLTKPSGCESPILRSYSNGAELTYVFDGWYDYPYEPNGNGTTGVAQTNLDVRTKNTIYYAHYKCETVYTITIYDKTQTTAYNGTDYEGKGYDVSTAIVYADIPAGSTFTLDMIYKGRQTNDGFMSGASLYAEAAFMNDYLGDGGKDSPNGPVTLRYNAKIAEYDPTNGDYATALSNLNALIAALEGRIEAYHNLLNEVYSYSYAGDDSFTKEYFSGAFLSHADYNEARRQLTDYNNDKELLTTYAANLLTAKSYYDKDAATEEGLYKKYADSYIDINTAAGCDMTDPDVKAKYRFSGWYTDEEYRNLFASAPNREMNFSWFASSKNLSSNNATQLTLYAKWADEDKGSEGLIFRAVYNSAGEPIGVVVADYMNKEEYEAASFYGCGYNDFDNYEYSVNNNDYGYMPVNLGTDIDLQIPARHGDINGEPLPVLGILRDAFYRHGNDIARIDLPNSIAFIEEGAFHGCYVDMISGTGDTSYVTIEGQRVVYQTNDYGTVKVYDRDTSSYSVIPIISHTLIGYATKVSTSETLLRVDTLTVIAGTVRIGDYAFYGANNLQYVALSDTLVSIGISAFENSGLRGSAEGNGDKLVLPAPTASIGAYAFRNCLNVRDIELLGNSISYVGRDAFATTGWYLAQKGIVAVNHIVIGIRRISDIEDLDHVGNSLTITNIGGRNKYSYTNDNGVMYYDAQDKVWTDVTIDDTVIGIAEYAFYYNNDSTINTVETVIVEGTLIYGIGDSAFRNCTTLSDVYLTNIADADTIHENAFAQCSSGLTIHL